MSVQETKCFALHCDGCGCGFNPADEGEILFSSVDEARTELRHYEWSTDGERDLCTTCTAADQCAKHGHVPALDTGGRYCDRCEEPL